jgi:hypothetical protein
MRLKSKIKDIFSDELLELTASICDTKGIQSAQKKMKVLRDLLYTHGVKFDILGGATNRIALFIDGYAVKFAMDNQGYKDNLMEYAISRELQPYVTKTYETNGYILVAECVKLMTNEIFSMRKYDILKILDSIASDYLLGDVGYLKKNMTNWGIRDNGELVILDYAYCHRATENLFTCSVCGEGVLSYDSSYDHLMCTNRMVCTTSYTYNERKSIQGDQVDYDMIEEAKTSSIILKKNETYKEVNTDDNKFIDTTKRYIRNQKDYQEYLEANIMISKNYDSEEALDNIVKLVRIKNQNPDEVKVIMQELGELTNDPDQPEFVMTDEFQSELIGNDYDSNVSYNKINGPFNEDSSVEEEDDDIEAYSLDDVIAKLHSNPVKSDEYTEDDGEIQLPTTHLVPVPKEDDEDDAVPDYILENAAKYAVVDEPTEVSVKVEVSIEVSDPSTEPDETKQSADIVEEEVDASIPEMPEDQVALEPNGIYLDGKQIN